MVYTTTLKELRPMLPKVVDRIDGKWDRYIVTRHGKPVIVMLSIEDYESIMETLDILADPSALQGIRKGMRDIKQSKTRSWEEVRKSLEQV